ncbi:unnamed protein product [Pylaiella littoralis]
MMPTSAGEDRTRLDGFEVEIFNLVKKEATSVQWKEWLRAPLEHAAAKGNMDLFTRLMDAGADGSAGWRGCHRRTLLGAAARGKNEKMVLALLKAGAKGDIDAVFNGDRASYRTSALYTAAYWGAEAVAKTLLIAGADATLPDSDGLTPLHVASRGGWQRLVEYLVVAGADPNAKTSGCLIGYTPLHFAACNNRVWCVSELLLVGADENAKDRNGETPLTLAVERNHLATVEKLLAVGARVDSLPRSDKFKVRGAKLGFASCLARAALRGYLGVLEALLRHGSKASGSGSTVDNNATALHFAAAFEGPGDNGNTVRALLNAGADVEAVLTEAANCSTPLHIAASRKITSSGTILALLERGANVHALDDLERAPLHTACYHSCAGAVELLLRWGADETLEDGLGDTATDLVGGWESDDEGDYFQEGVNNRRQQRLVDNERIGHMLARAPADRSWRRRGWLVLCRMYPSKVQLSADCRIGNDADMGGHADQEGETTKMVRRRVSPVGGAADGSAGGTENGKETMVDFARLVGRLVGIEAECVFRLVVGYL